jgi:ATP-dependent helicase/nuclease subunit A
MNYLDTGKSVMISAPAGSGKTQKLAGRYIALVKSGVDVERILAVTFTEKAAAEMKQRILSNLASEDEGLFHKILHRMPLMRVLTLHAFCGTLLRRFSFEAAIDPNYEISDAVDSALNWEETLYQVLMDAGRGLRGHELLYNTLGEKGFRGLDYLRGTVDYLYQKNPFSLEAETPPFNGAISEQSARELSGWPGAADSIEGYEDYFRADGIPSNPALEHCFLTANNTPRRKATGALKNIPDFKDWAFGMYRYWKDRKRVLQINREERIREIFRSCLQIYGNRKHKQGVLDFSDLEYVTYKMLTENPEWANILHAFDEKTDHILVDEFQDINSYQWEIINSLTEEWRAGMGSKRDEGISPTVFFVGDVKQSIYFFRGANVEIFSRTRDRMALWLGDEFLYEEARVNYRSRPAIIEFSNHLFTEVMKTGDSSPSWVTRYSEFETCREGDAGEVELIVCDSDVENTKEAKEREADMLAVKIKSMVGNFLIARRGDAQKRPCAYEDMAILLRKRTHLRAYEESLRRHGIPFVAVKGIGFYQEPEVAVLRSLLYFLSNPGDDYSLYILLKSPLFGIDDNTVLEIMDKGRGSLLQKMQIANGDGNGFIAKTFAQLNRWLTDVSVMPMAELMENVLVQTGAWRFYHEPQRRANIRKFMRIIEELEAEGRTIIRVRDFLERTLDRLDEPKANVNAEGMDAVKIMTIHASKGLEFPVVFVPGLEEPFYKATGENLIFEREGRFYFKSEPESSIRKEDDDFLLHLAKEEEEQKRLFYVAVTRAEEALILSGSTECRANSFMAMLKSALEIKSQDSRFSFGVAIPGFSILTEADIMSRQGPSEKRPVKPPGLKRVQVIPLTVKKQVPWKGVTESADIRRRHGREWQILGDIIHGIFEGVSKGRLNEEKINERAERMLASRGVPGKDRPAKLEVIKGQIASLQARGVWQEVITPQAHAYTELPFVLQAEDEIYSGRIDRVIRTGGTYSIYDYKTFPVRKEDISYYMKGYTFQLDVYKQAVMKLFGTEDVKAFIVFTHTGDVKGV